MSSLAFCTAFSGANIGRSRRTAALREPAGNSTFIGYVSTRKRRRCRLHSSIKRVIFPETIRRRQIPSASSSADPSNSHPPGGIDFRLIRKSAVALSFLGAAETSYLTLNKIFSSPGAICSTQGCLDVLTGPFSSFLGIPLTLFGVLAYSAFLYLSVWPLAADAETNDEGEVLRTAEQVYAARDAATRPLMFALSTMMLVFSGFLMWLLFYVVQSMCPYCIASAVLSVALFVLTTLVGRAVPALADALRVGAVSSVAASLAAAVMFFISLPAQIRAQPPAEPQSAPAITMRSTSDTMVRTRGWSAED